MVGQNCDAAQHEQRAIKSHHGPSPVPVVRLLFGRKRLEDGGPQPIGCVRGIWSISAHEKLLDFGCRWFVTFLKTTSLKTTSPTSKYFKSSFAAVSRFTLEKINIL
jgi:hypothetical protein